MIFDLLTLSEYKHTVLLLKETQNSKAKYNKSKCAATMQTHEKIDTSPVINPGSPCV